eukprot:7064699-Prymnesium_polylepis.1
MAVASSQEPTANVLLDSAIAQTAKVLLGGAAPMAMQLHGAAAPMHLKAGSTVGWQEHSKNDLRSWPQLLRKGGRNFKIDPNFQGTLFCALQQRVAHKGDARGCFVLNHDTPGLLSGFRSGYNTTDDVLSFIEDVRYRSYFTRADPFLVTLCFKNMATPCGSGSRSLHWRSLINSFFGAANVAVARASLNVRFVLDGDAAGGAMCDCINDRWRPWVATYIPDGGQQPGACLDDAFTSNNRSRGLDRFAILNVKSESFASAAARHYGKFTNSSYNWQIYEPRDQAEIDTRLREYAAAGVSHAAGLRFAINIDSSMLQVWAAGANLTGRSSWSDTIAPNGSAPSSVVLLQPATNGTRRGQARRVLTVAYVDSQQQSRFVLFSFTGPPGAPLTLSDAGPLPIADNSSTPPQELSSTTWQGEELILASGGTGHVSALHVADDNRTGTPHLLAGARLEKGGIVPISAHLALPGDAYSSSCASPCPNGTGPAVVCVAQLAVDAQRQLQLRMWAIDASVPPTSIPAASGATLLSSLQLAMPSGIPVETSGAGH